MDLPSIERLVARHGLHLRGGFHPTADDGVPSLADGRMPVTLILVGREQAGTRLERSTHR